jgi:hypothetical protein
VKIFTVPVVVSPSPVSPSPLELAHSTAPSVAIAN